MLIACEFRAKRHSEGRSFLTCADAIFTFTSKERLGEVRTLVTEYTHTIHTHTIHNLVTFLHKRTIARIVHAVPRGHIAFPLLAPRHDEGSGEERAVTCGRSGPDRDVLTNTMS